MKLLLLALALSCAAAAETAEPAGKWNTGDADKIELLVRTIQIQDTVGAKIAVRDIDLRPAGE